MKYLLICLIAFITTLSASEEQKFIEADPSQTATIDETDDIYWETPKYLSKLEQTAYKVKYVYHRRANNFIGEWILPLNMMPYMDGFSEIYQLAVSKYAGREQLLTRVIPTLNCLWNDVIFFSPLHPHKHYEEYKKIGFTPKHVQVYKIPIEVLKEKRLTVWKWLSYKKYAPDDPIHEAIESYCAFDFSHYQELEELPDDTKEFYLSSFNPDEPTTYPRFNWYRIPHILCQDPIDLHDERITLIDWEDPIEVNGLELLLR